MNRPTTRRSALALVLCAASVATVQGVTSPTAGASQPRSSAVSSVSSSAVGKAEDQTARSLAASLADPAWRAQVRSAALSSDQVDLRALAARATGQTGRALAPAVAGADHRIAAAKGLTSKADSLLQVRLGTKAMRKALTAGTIPWVASTVDDDHAKTITAYDSRGGTHTLDMKQAPDHPVYVVGIDVSAAVSAGLGVVDKEFAKHGLTSPLNAARPADGGFSATRVDSVYLNDDEEPWVEGDAEVFSIVSGFGFDGKVRVDTVEMPYLDDDGHTYYPNQILVNWSNYKYNLADVVMMEDDGDTNYSALAKALADALLTITDQGAYIPLVDAILGAIPASWWTNDPDYVDSWYTMSKDSSGQLNGARGNGRMTVSPYFVSQL